MKYFDLREFSCKHCGVALMDDEFLAKMDWLREEYGAPLRITSGYRCPTHNRAVSSTGGNGPHTTGHAADIAVDRARAVDLLDIALSSGKFTGFGLNQKGNGRFIHLDDLDRPERTIWTY